VNALGAYLTVITLSSERRESHTREPRRQFTYGKKKETESACTANERKRWSLTGKGKKREENKIRRIASTTSKETSVFFWYWKALVSPIRQPSRGGGKRGDPGMEKGGKTKNQGRTMRFNNPRNRGKRKATQFRLKGETLEPIIGQFTRGGFVVAD